MSSNYAKVKIVPLFTGSGRISSSEYDGKRCRTDSRVRYAYERGFPMRVMVLPHSRPQTESTGARTLGIALCYGPTDRFDISNTTDLSGLLKKLETKPGTTTSRISPQSTCEGHGTGRVKRNSEEEGNLS